LRLIAGILQKYNHQLGRAENSTIDLDAYCPKDILQAPGPLFGDTENIQAAYDSFIGERVTDIKFNLCKCFVCGYPDCSCKTCLAIIATKTNGKKTKPKLRHECALFHAATGGGAPPADGYYDAELKSKLCLAWNEKGIMDPPVFSKQKTGSGYYWPEEL